LRIASAGRPVNGLVRTIRASAALVDLVVDLESLDTLVWKQMRFSIFGHSGIGYR
jgi:hypothetical protein